MWNMKVSAMSSFFQNTLKEIGIKEEANQLPEELRSKTAAKTTDWRYFFPDERGNLCIRYFALPGGSMQFRKKGNKWPEPFIRTRFKPGQEPKSESGKPIKYISPKRSGQHPFITPKVHLAYGQKKKIKTLALVEGEKKAMAGDVQGMHIIGIPSIHGFYGEQKQNGLKALHPDVVEIIKACKVDRLIYLTDADTLSLNYEPNKEMTERPIAFRSAVRNFRQVAGYLLKEPSVALQSIHFMHIRSEYEDRAKGLDDLFQHYPDERNAILQDFRKRDKAKKYFQGIDISQGTEKLDKYFGLEGVARFYGTYKDYLGEEPFLYFNAKYIWNGEEPVFMHHGDVKKFLRIGPDWMKEIRQVNKHGDEESSLIKWNISEIERDYKRFKGFVDQIPKYDAFCNEPDWTENYKRVHNSCYNLANPLPHNPQYGHFDTIIRFLKHLFQGEGELSWNEDLETYDEKAITGDIFTVGMDWLNIIYRHPKQLVPVPILVSPENNTGKSTFLKFLQSLFGGNNVAILNNDQFKSNFNAHYITKFIIGIDESFLDVDKKAEKERLKQLVTADSMLLEHKGMDMKKFPYHGKVIMASNDADNVMKIEDNEDRWFVVRVPKIPTDQKDPDMEKKMLQEIQAFLAYLEDRNIHHPREDRLWFKPQHFITDQYKKIVQNTKSYLERMLDDFLIEQFQEYGMSVLKYDVKTLTRLINERGKWKINEPDLRSKLKKEYGMKPSEKPEHFQYPAGFQESMDSGDPTPMMQAKTGRYFTFEAKNFLDPEDMDRIYDRESDGKKMPF